MWRRLASCAAVFIVSASLVWTGGSATAEDGCNNGDSINSSVFIAQGAPTLYNENDAWRFRAKRTDNAGLFYVRSYDKSGVRMMDRNTTYEDLYIGYWNVNFPRLAEREAITNKGPGSVFNYDRWCTKA